MIDDHRILRWGAAAGIVGPQLLTAYFTAPALAGWPYSGASPEALTAYARSHSLLFYAGGWLQATGASSASSSSWPWFAREVGPTIQGPRSSTSGARSF